MPTDDAPAVHKRRPRYPGKNPRRFHEKYKELNPERYGDEVQKIVESGKTPAGMHRAIMVDEVLAGAGAARRATSPSTARSASADTRARFSSAFSRAAG